MEIETRHYVKCVTWKIYIHLLRSWDSKAIFGMRVVYILDVHISIHTRWFIFQFSQFPDSRQVCDYSNHMTLRINYLISMHISLAIMAERWLRNFSLGEKIFSIFNFFRHYRSLGTKHSGCPLMDYVWYAQQRSSYNFSLNKHEKAEFKSNAQCERIHFLNSARIINKHQGWLWWKKEVPREEGDNLRPGKFFIISRHNLFTKKI